MGKEVYLNAPLAWVTAEIRYPQSPRLRQQVTLDQIQLGLESVLPIAVEEQQLTMQFGPLGPASQDGERAYRLMNREKTLSAVIGPRAITVETSAYTRSEEFLDLVGTVTDVVFQCVSLLAIERIGLRYINEVRVPDRIDGVRGWNVWIAPALTAASDIGVGCSATTVQGVVHYHVGDDLEMAFRYAALPAGTIIGLSVMRRPEFDPDRPVFVLDFDSFWEAKDPGMALAPGGAKIRGLLDDLHRPISGAFESTLTDRLRELFRRGQG